LVSCRFVVQLDFAVWKMIAFLDDERALAVDWRDLRKKTAAKPSCVATTAHRHQSRGTAMKMKLASVLLVLPMAIFPAVAFAHTGLGATSGFMHGVSHPISGLDHLLAMIMVGVLAWQMGGRALWLVPATFVAVMAAGGALGVAGVDVPYVETGIALSVIVLGVAVAFGVKPPVVAAVAVVGMFAVFHGHAHGAEMPENAGGLAYALGFTLATASLHATGIGVGFLIGRASEGSILVRGAGALAAAAGVGILTGLV
jgi:urease accessory protein